MNSKSASAPLPGPTSWHALSNEQVLAALKTSSEGLTDVQAQERLTQYGPNRLPETQRRSLLARFFSHFHNVLIYVLLAAATITAALGHWVDTGVILAVVMVNAVIGFVQEGKAEKAMDAIRRMPIELPDSGEIVYLEDIRASTTNDVFSAERGVTPEMVILKQPPPPDPVFSMMDMPRQREYRRVFAPRYTRRAIAGLEDSIRAPSARLPVAT